MEKMAHEQVGFWGAAYRAFAVPIALVLVIAAGALFIVVMSAVLGALWLVAERVGDWLIQFLGLARLR